MRTQPLLMPTPRLSSSSSSRSSTGLLRQARGYLTVMLDNRLITDIAATGKDLRNVRDISGLCKACAVAKMKHRPTAAVSSIEILLIRKRFLNFE